MTNLCGIICEYNPFHNGHAYQIQKTKEIVNCPIVCIMSGDFVQRAEPALIDKRIRATLALQNGADAIIELPTVFSTAGGRQFASGAIEQLSNIENLRYLSFGIETDNPQIIQHIADIQLEESQNFKNELNIHLKSGKSYAHAYAKATQSQLKSLNYTQIQIESTLNGANNILAVEYIKAIKQKNLNIQPIFISRTDKGYNDTSLTPPYASATAIRRLIEHNIDYSSFAPKSLPSIVSSSAYNAIIRSSLLALTPKIRNKFPTNQEILDRKILISAQNNLTVESIAQAAKSKAFTLSHIKRRILQLSLNIPPQLLNHTNFHSRLLAIKQSFKSYLKYFPSSISAKSQPISTTYNNEMYFNLQTNKNAQQKIDQSAINEISQQIYKIDKRASDLYAVITNQSTQRFYQKLITIDDN